jgi:hypothetical protein
MSNIRYAFLVPFISVYVLYFAVRGYRPAHDLPKEAELQSIPVQN